MATVSEVFKWMPGNGWLVLSGGHTGGSVIRAQALRRALSYGGVAYIGVGEDSSDDTLDDMEDLGAPTGYHVNVRVLDDDVIRDQIAESAMVMLDESDPLPDLRSGLLGAGIDAIRDVYERGGVVLAEGASASLFARYLFLSANRPPIEGFNWLENSLILPQMGVELPTEAVQSVLNAHPHAIVVMIGAESALALGPQGEIEIWGKRQVTIALGQGYNQEEG